MGEHRSDHAAVEPAEPGRGPHGRGAPGLRLLPFVLALVFSAVAFFTPAQDLPETNVWDKASHAAMFAVLVLAGWLAALPRRKLVVGLFGYAVMSEILQAVLPIGRMGDWHDVLADSVGIGLGAALAVAVTGLCPTSRVGRGAQSARVTWRKRRN